jgi:uncharacterized protein YutE (UPF0331/DUF86 family)
MRPRVDENPVWSDAQEEDGVLVVECPAIPGCVAGRLEQASAERLLERTITRMIDITYHVITASGHPPPADYCSSFLTLPDLGILADDCALRIAQAAGLRNGLDYDDLDPRKMFDAIGSR